MDWFWWISGVALAAIWLGRQIDGLFGLGKIGDLRKTEWDRRPQPEPSLLVVVPARNEEKAIGAALESLSRLDYGDYRVIAVNDRSTDRTGEIMDEAAARSGGRIKVLHISDLPAGWLGKTHAMWQAAQQAETEWVLFTDGDVIFREDALRRAMVYAMERQADHVVAYPTIVMHTFAERAMVALFQVMSIFYSRAWKVSDPKARDFTGMGAFNLVRRSAYGQIGTFAALRLQVVEDLALGKRLKQAGFRQQVAQGFELLKLRWYEGGLGFVETVGKNFFAVFEYRPERALVAAGGVLFLNIVPFLGVWLAPGMAKIPHAVVLASIFGIYCFMSLGTTIRPWHFVAHPAAAAVMAYAIVRSMVLTLHQGGVVWRGTKYDLAELRKGMVR